MGQMEPGGFPGLSEVEGSPRVGTDPALFRAV
jgi:hypothetical protein